MGAEEATRPREKEEPGGRQSQETKEFLVFTSTALIDDLKRRRFALELKRTTTKPSGTAC
jgi:hypothetical protein